MNHGFTYRALEANHIDTSLSYSTDAQLSIHDLVLLEDNRNYFTSYSAGILVREETMDQYPEIRPVLTKLNGIISEKDMREMNMLVDHEGLSARCVAHNYLRRKELLP